jgi:nucleoside-diphosphate-sugar epimerase
MSSLPDGWRLKHSDAGRLIHVSGIGADPGSQSLYIRKRGEGELAVREAFADAILIRPAVMFGPDDAFLTPILKLHQRLPYLPIFGNGRMRLQPVYLEDVGQAIAKIMEWEQTGPTMFECGGAPRLLLRSQLPQVLFWLGLISIPFAWLVWYVGPQMEMVRQILASISDPALRAALQEAHAERLGLWVAVWPVTLLVLSQILEKKIQE